MLGLFDRRTSHGVTHLVEAEDPTTGESRMFSAPTPEQAQDAADRWLDGLFGSLHEVDDVVWDSA